MLLSCLFGSHKNENNPCSFYQTVLGLNKMKLPAAYTACNYPTEELDTLVRLCLIDSNFPTFVSEVEKVVNNMTGKPGANTP